MSYVIYNKETTKIVRVIKTTYWQDAEYKTEAAAKAGFTRMEKKGKVNRKDYAIAERGYFSENIEKTEVRYGVAMAHGQKFVVGVNTPWSAGPWSEAYWSA